MNHSWRLYRFIRLRLWFGQLNIKHRDQTLYSERYGKVPTMVIGPVRLTWRKYRSLDDRSREPRAGGEGGADA